MRISPSTHKAIVLGTTFCAALFFSVVAPWFGIPLLLLVLYRTARSLTTLFDLRTARQRADQARMEQIRFHLQGSVRRPEVPRPPKRERLF